MVEHQTSILNSNHLVHGWLMDVPGYRDNYRNERQLNDLNDISETDEMRYSLWIIGLGERGYRTIIEGNIYE
jgi:hypothetical protein